MMPLYEYNASIQTIFADVLPLIPKLLELRKQ